MATNAIHIRRPSDRNLYLIAAAVFPLLVLIGYFKTYYFRAFFDVAPFSSWLVHAHGLVMSAWVVYFVAQVALVRTKNLKLHMTMGFAGIGLAVLAVITGLAAAFNAHLIDRRAPAGIDPYGFFLIPTADMVLFVILFTAAIIYRKRPAQHKSLMFLTAINFLPAAVSRIPVVPDQFMLFWAFGAPMVLALAAFGWHTWKQRKFNAAFAGGIALLIVAFPLRLMLMGTAIWIKFAGWLASWS